MAGRERGDGKLSLFIFLAILAAAIFAAWRIIPPRVNAYEFRDEMTKWNTDPDYRMRRADEETVMKELLQRASGLNLPIKKENLKIRRDGEWMRMKATFDVPVDLKVYTYVMHFEFEEPKT